MIAILILICGGLFAISFGYLMLRAASKPKQSKMYKKIRSIPYVGLPFGTFMVSAAFLQRGGGVLIMLMGIWSILTGLYRIIEQIP